MSIYEFSWFLATILLVILWIGHACIWTWMLNVSYGLAFPKRFLRPFRLFVGLVILAGLPLFAWLLSIRPHDIAAIYCGVCGFIGGLVFPVITWFRYGAPRPPCVTLERSRVLRLWDTHGPALLGDGRWRWLTRVPLNDPFTVEFTELTIAHDRLPKPWAGMTVLFLSDFHFYGTPSQAYFQAVLDEIARQPVPDLLVLAGDYVDSIWHHEWIEPLLGQLKWKEGAFAILGNHDLKFRPKDLQRRLEALGITVVSNRWCEATIRGERCIVVGNESPWRRPRPRLSELPKDAFRLGIAHSPDQFEWARGRLDMLFCGHTHGGQVRLPVIGSIFVPCISSRRYDQGVFHSNNTVMVVSRGLSGKEPIRFRCPTQVIRITLTHDDND